MTDSPSDPEQILSREDAANFIRVAKIIFDTMGDAERNPKVLVMEPKSDDENKIIQLHFLCFRPEKVSGNAETLSESGDTV